MKLYLDFEPCNECKVMMNELSSGEFMFADEKTKEEESAKFLRHLTYNHNEIVKAVIKELPIQKRRQEYDWFR